jgi:hypothetical protein
MIRTGRVVFAAMLQIVIAGALGGPQAQAQGSNSRIALKSNESIELHPVYWIANCRSIMIGLPVVEVLEGPEELTLSIKEGNVLPRRQNCSDRVPGGTLMATTKEVAEPKQAKLTYRLKYKTKDGDRQTSHAFNVSLFP